MGSLSDQQSTFSPDTTLAIGDPGDETYQRYRYQSTYAAIQALDTLKSTPKVLEVLCEHHEDILMKLSTGKFHGIQVKTRHRRRPHWKASDPEIIAAFSRFVEHTLDFGEQFSGYTFATNQAFYDEQNNGRNVNYLVTVAKDIQSGKRVDGNKALEAFVDRLLVAVFDRLQTATSKASMRDCATRRRLALGDNKSEQHRLIIEVLTHVELDDQLPDIDGIQRTLRDQISMYDERFKDATIKDLYEASLVLTNLAFRASSRYREDVTPSYLGVKSRGVADMTALIEAKRLTPAKLRQELTRVQLKRLSAVDAAAPEPPTKLTPETTFVLDIAPDSVRLMKSGEVQVQVPRWSTKPESVEEPSSWEREPEAAGQRLRDLVLPVALQSVLDTERQGGGFRFRVRTGRAETQQLPWGYLFEPERGFVATGRDTPFMFLSEKDYAALRRPLERSRFKIAYALSCPRSMESDIQEKLVTMYDHTQEALARIEDRGEFDLLPIDSCTLFRLFDSLQTAPDIFHLVAPMENGRILLEDGHNGVRSLTPLQVTERIGAAQLVIFDIAQCDPQTSILPELFDSVHQVNGCVSVQWHIGSAEEAEGWRRIFYQKLAETGETDVALNTARALMQVAERPWHRLNGALRRAEDYRLHMAAGAALLPEGYRFVMGGLGRPRKFLGPRQSLVDITESLLARTTYRAVMILGAKGSGKTDAACFSLWHVRGSLDGAWTCRCDEYNGFSEFARGLLGYLERSLLAQGRMPAAGVTDSPRLFAEWLGNTLLRPRRFVIYFDGVDNWLHARSGSFIDQRLADFVATLLEQASGLGRLLMTTRRRVTLPRRSRREQFLVVNVKTWGLQP